MFLLINDYLPDEVNIEEEPPGDTHLIEGGKEVGNNTHAPGEIPRSNPINNESKGHVEDREPSSLLPELMPIPCTKSLTHS